MPVTQLCPLCGEARFLEIKRFPDGVVVGACAACGLLHTPLRHPQPESVHGEPPLAELTERYGAILRGERRHYRHRVYADYLTRIGRHVSEGRLLDVGCAQGFFLAEARRRGYTVSGVESNPGMATFAREGLGLDVTTGLWSGITPPAEGFHVVSFADSLEYMPDPVEALRRARQVLAPGGIVFVKTPNAAYFRLRHAVARRVGGDRGTGEAFHPSSRVVHFAPDTLARTAVLAGLEPIEAGAPTPVPSPRWKRRTGVWMEFEAPLRHALVERSLRGILTQLGRLEAALTRGTNHLSPAIYLIARASAPK